MRSRRTISTAPRTWIFGVAAVVLVAVLVTSVTQLRPSPTRPVRPVEVTTSAWEPFVSPALPGGGPLTEIVVETLRRQGLDPRVTFSSWPAALERAERGQVLGAFPLIRSERRTERFVLSDPIYEFEYVLFYHLDAWPDPPAIETAADLRDLRIGLVDGYDVWGELDDAVETFVEFDTTLDAFEALADGRIDLLPEGRLPGRILVESGRLRDDARSFAEIDPTGNPLLGATESVHVLFPRTDEGRRVASAFDAALADVRTTDLYRDMVEALAAGPVEIAELEPVAGDPLVRLWFAGSGSAHAVAPRGTRVQVLEWPEPFRDAGAADGTVPRVRVKVLNGPSRGFVVYAAPESLRLVPGETG